ncbi:MAG: helix-turn-helix transcriptional regulator [Actinomycetota bacterium]
MVEPGGGRLGKRLRRILVMLPYVIANPGVSVEELAQKFSAKEADLIADLNMMFFCGLPGYGPGDLIEVSIDDDGVFVSMADYFKQPLRITPAEALALYAGGAAVASLPGMEQADALKRALGKLQRALGGGSDEVGGIEIQMEPGPAAHLELLQQALEQRRRVRLEYLSASRGELTERAVDPWGLVAALGHWYLVGFDHLRGDERMFRTDRVKAITLLDEAAELPDDFDRESYRGGFRGKGAESLVMEISPAVASWFEDYYPVTSSIDLPDGWRRVELIAGGTRWAAVLVLRLGAEARNIEPSEVTDEARAMAASIARNHARV